jgi:hypothetical protein
VVVLVVMIVEIGRCCFLLSFFMQMDTNGDESSKS